MCVFHSSSDCQMLMCVFVFHGMWCGREVVDVRCLSACLCFMACGVAEKRWMSGAARNRTLKLHCTGLQQSGPPHDLNSIFDI